MKGRSSPEASGFLNLSFSGRLRTRSLMSLKASALQGLLQGGMPPIRLFVTLGGRLRVESLSAPRFPCCQRFGVLFVRGCRINTSVQRRDMSRFWASLVDDLVWTMRFQVVQGASFVNITCPKRSALSNSKALHPRPCT